MAHSGAGYADNLIVQWCLTHGLNPDMIIRQGSIITFLRLEQI